MFVTTPFIIGLDTLLVPSSDPFFSGLLLCFSELSQRHLPFAHSCASDLVFICLWPFRQLIPHSLLLSFFKVFKAHKCCCALKLRNTCSLHCHVTWLHWKPPFCHINNLHLFYLTPSVFVSEDHERSLF